MGRSFISKALLWSFGVSFLTGCAVEVETVSLLPKKSLVSTAITGRVNGDLSPINATVQVKSGYTVRSAISFGVGEGEVVKSGYTIKSNIQAQ